LQRIRTPLARILHEAFYCERRKHGIFVRGRNWSPISSELILEVRTRMYFSTIRPQTSRINFALRARTFRTSIALVTKFRAICGLAWIGPQCYTESNQKENPCASATIREVRSCWA
jgi:hypothetical protein